MGRTMTTPKGEGLASQGRTGGSGQPGELRRQCWLLTERRKQTGGEGRGKDW